MEPPAPTHHIHILGLGNLSKLISHSLSTLPDPPLLTLLTYHPTLLPSSPITLTLTRHNTPLPSPPLGLALTTAPGAPISHLILTTKSPTTTGAILPLLPRLSSTSTILFTQNGMGAMDEIAALFRADAQPTFLSAIVTHGVFSTGPLKIGRASCRERVS